MDKKVKKAVFVSYSIFTFFIIAALLFAVIYDAGIHIRYDKVEATVTEYAGESSSSDEKRWSYDYVYNNSIYHGDDRYSGLIRQRDNLTGKITVKDKIYIYVDPNDPSISKYPLSIGGMIALSLVCVFLFAVWRFLYLVVTNKIDSL